MNRVLLVSLFLLVAAAVVQGQAGYWEEAKGPYGGNGIIWPSNNNVIYINITPNIVFRSTNYGANWTRIDVARVDTASLQERLRGSYSGDFYALVSFEQAPDTIQRLYRSTDEGANWSQVNDNVPVSDFMETATGILVGANNVTKQIYRSADNGTSWEIVHTNVPGKQLFSLNGTSLTNGTIFFNQGDAWGISIDNGATWVFRLVPDGWIAPTLMPSGTIFLLPKTSSPNNTIQRSVDGGTTWEPFSVPVGTNERPSSVVGLANGRILLATYQNLYFSEDDGISWQQMPSHPEQPESFFLNGVLSNGHILGNRKASFFRSNDIGETWTFSASGIRLGETFQAALVSEALHLAVNPSGLWRTDDGGISWERILADTGLGYQPQLHRLAYFDEDSIAVSLSGEVWITGDGGGTFSNHTPAAGLATYNKNLFAGFDQTLFCSGSTGVLRSDGFGAPWDIVIPDVSLVALERHHNASILFALTEPLGLNNFPIILQRSTNGGLTWLPVTSLTAFPIKGQAVWVDHLGKIYVLCTEAFGSNSVLAISNDLGVTWEYKSIPCFLIDEDLIIVNATGKIFVTSVRSQILASADMGNSWYTLPKVNENVNWTNGLLMSPTGLLYCIPSIGNWYRTTSSTEIGAFITGHVRRDADAECSTPDAQQPLKNWVVSLEGANNWFALTNADGRYTFFVDTGLYQLRVEPTQPIWWGLCDNPQTIHSDSLFSADTIDFAALALAECPLISVSVGASFLRRCFDNIVYVQYCNQGTETADSARVDVFLDEFLDFVSADLPHEALGNNTYRFQLGTVTSGECDQFGFMVHVDCAGTVLGQTHCITAHGYPDTLCTPVQNWSGAIVVAEAECQDTSVLLRLRNIGPMPSQLLNYIIIEDDVVLMSGQDEHQPGGLLSLERPANGHTWRIESQQEPGHPFSSVAVAFLEGCGGYESLGFVNQYEVNTFQPSWNRLCLENIGAYDPNDKQGFPLGYGEEHRIRPGQELDYMIRFQNTGTDTAFNIVIRDTLSPWLDPASVRPGAASHPYTWTLSGTGALQFTFANILLPDSNVNLAGSQGFVRFRISQRPEVPIGAKIHNEAAIYFDFNDPIITNQTLHTVGVDYLTSTSERPGTERPDWVTVSPNPVRDAAVFQRKDGRFFDGHRLVVTDALGRAVFEERVFGKQAVFQRRGLPGGVYFFRVEDRGGRLVDAGVVVVD